jgi:hypothetical protein
VATEAAWDGGNLKISVDGGPWALVAPADWTYNAYNGTLNSVAAGNTNPLAGQRSFTGSDGGSVEGSWGRSHVRLANYAPPGSTVRLRWEFGTDGCGGAFGWYVDDVTVYACTSNTAPTITVNDISVVEGNTGFSDGAFTVSLSHAFAQPVSMKYKFFDGTAKRGNDYLPYDGLFERVFTVPALTTTFTVPVRVKGDWLVEPDETFRIQLSKPENGVFGDDSGTATIVNDDTP